MKHLFLILTCLFVGCCTITAGNISNLKGKTIVFATGFNFVPDFNSQYKRGVYCIDATKKNEYKKKYFITDEIKGLKIYVEDVVVINPEKVKRTAIVIKARRDDNSIIAIYIPCYYWSETIWPSGRPTTIYKHNPPEDTSFSYYDYNEIIKDNNRLKNKRFFIKRNNTPYLFQHFTMKEGKLSAFYSSVKEGITERELTPEDYQLFVNSIILEDFYIEKCRNRYDSFYVDSLRNRFLNREVHFHDYRNEGFYVCDSIEIGNWITNNSGIDYRYIMFLSNEKKAIKVDIGNKLTGLELASVWKENERIKRQEEERQANEQQEQEAKEEARYRAQLVRKYGNKNAQLIMDGEVRIGFTKAMCIDSWGKPSRVNRTTTQYGVHEQWVYGIGNYLYFVGNRLTGIQD